jgi:rhodanese-related sulfurtransferase
MPIDVSRAEVQNLAAHGARIVEVLPAKEYEEEHLAGAMSIPLKELEVERVAALDPDQRIVVYCWDYT